MPLHRIRSLVITNEEPLEWILERKCVMCGGEIKSLEDALLGVHESSLEDVHSGVAFHRGSCAEAFEVFDAGVEGPFDADSYFLHDFIPEATFKRREAYIDILDIRERTTFQLSQFDSELQMEAAWLRDGHNRVALAVYDGATCLIERVTEDTEDPLHQTLIKYFTTS